jgi:predicted transcriptional regulator
MPIVIRFVSGSLAGREFTFPNENVRIGDADGVDLRVDPAQPGDGGARGRVVEVSVEGAGFRVRSAGNRELSAQGEMPLDHPVADGGEVRFGAWGPIFSVRRVSGESSRTAPVPIPIEPPPPPRPDDTASRRRMDDTASRMARSVLTASGEKPVGPKTVMVMIQEALSKAREQGDAGFVEKGTVFVREVVSETIQSATRSLKIGLLLTASALVILAFALAFNVYRTRQTVERVTQAADESVQGVRKELGTRVEEMKVERDALAAESAEVARKLGELEKTAGASEKAVSELRTRLTDAETRRKDLEGRMQRALSTLESDKESLQRQLQQMEKDRAADRARQQAEIEKLRQEAAAPVAVPVEPTAAPTPAPR